MGRIEDRKPFRGKCPICGACQEVWQKSWNVANAWTVEHLGRRHAIRLPLDALRDASFVVERVYAPTRQG